MVELPLHPLLVHIPVGLAVAVAILAPAVWLTWARGALPRRAWWLVPLVQGFLLVSVVAAVRTGELAEQEARRVLPGEQVDRHETLGTRFIVLVVVTLLLALAASLVADERRARQLALAAIISSLVQLAACAVVSHAGGALVWGPDGLIEQRGPSADP
ncbi:MAG TPA: DUF2231 domain-containing protein [Myxococcota bacterium]|nr:DUF2231 domain-containing protein [Myxococcota bacterium]